LIEAVAVHPVRGKGVEPPHESAPKSAPESPPELASLDESAPESTPDELPLPLPDALPLDELPLPEVPDDPLLPEDDVPLADEPLDELAPDEPELLDEVPLEEPEALLPDDEPSADNEPSSLGVKPPSSNWYATPLAQATRGNHTSARTAATAPGARFQSCRAFTNSSSRVSLTASRRGKACPTRPEAHFGRTTQEMRRALVGGDPEPARQRQARVRVQGRRQLADAGGPARQRAARAIRTGPVTTAARAGSPPAPLTGS
jgi:hypothetical protein